MGIPGNPHYGSGQYLRSLEILRLGDREYAFAMEDSYHAFAVTFRHDGSHLSALQAHWHRQPMGSCSGAGKALERMVGCPLSDDIYAAGQFQDGRLHCTHHFDMLSLAIVHAHQEREDRRYDVVIADAPAGNVCPELFVNDRSTLCLQLRDHQYITSPGHYQGVSLMRGFNVWAREHLEAEEREYAFIIQKAMFVAAGQQMNIPAMVGKPAPLSGPTVGTCYASRQADYAESTRLNTLRDLSGTRRQDMLAFFSPSRLRQ